QSSSPSSVDRLPKFSQKKIKELASKSQLNPHAPDFYSYKFQQKTESNSTKTSTRQAVNKFRTQLSELQNNHLSENNARRASQIDLPSGIKCFALNTSTFTYQNEACCEDLLDQMGSCNQLFNGEILANLSNEFPDGVVLNGDAGDYTVDDVYENERLVTTTDYQFAERDVRHDHLLHWPQQQQQQPSSEQERRVGIWQQGELTDGERQLWSEHMKKLLKIERQHGGEEKQHHRLEEETQPGYWMNYIHPQLLKSVENEGEKGYESRGDDDDGGDMEENLLPITLPDSNRTEPPRITARDMALLATELTRRPTFVYSLLNNYISSDESRSNKPVSLFSVPEIVEPLLSICQFLLPILIFCY
ncbi:hypothetical protein HELRODRAFT_184283, partial [Helobdella robusta]